MNRYFSQDSRIGFHLLKIFPRVSQAYRHSQVHMSPVLSGFKDIEQFKAKLHKLIFSFACRLMLQQKNTKPLKVKQSLPMYSLACDYISSNII